MVQEGVKKYALVGHCKADGKGLIVLWDYGTMGLWDYCTLADFPGL